MPACAGPQLRLPACDIRRRLPRRMQATGSEGSFIWIFYVNHLVGLPPPPQPLHHLLATAFASGACSPALSWARQGHTPWLS